jgi:hypothetical protein
MKTLDFSAALEVIFFTNNVSFIVLINLYGLLKDKAMFYPSFLPIISDIACKCT